jgi:two-component system alkaline phosphatase synthesis response regulator PhoP
VSEQKTILVVDDEPDYANIVQGHLKKAGYLVDVVYSGAEALERVKKTPPDLIVLDVMMPEMDGYEVCSELKGNSDTADIPVIMLTAVASQVPSTRYSHYDAMSLEAEDYLPKPATAEQIRERVANLLK